MYLGSSQTSKVEFFCYSCKKAPSQIFGRILNTTLKYSPKTRTIFGTFNPNLGGFFSGAFCGGEEEGIKLTPLSKTR